MPNRARPSIVWVGLAFASILVILRGAYRTAELAEGWNGYLNSEEVRPVLLCRADPRSALVPRDGRLGHARLPVDPRRDAPRPLAAAVRGPPESSQLCA